MMVQFNWPWALVLLLAPLIIYRYWPGQQTEPDTAMLRVPFLTDFEQPALQTVSLPWGVVFLLCACWLCLVAAAARPVWQGEPVALQRTGRDLFLAIDLSGSMKMDDFTLGSARVSRLQATKAVANDFIQRRKGDRIGLILFGSRPYVQAPLTFDRSTVRTFLDESVIGLAGEKTAIGDAIGLAVKQLRELPADERVLILLTDGANTAGATDPVEAAQFALKEQITIYTIGVGSEEMLVPSLFGNRRINPSQDLDEDTLKNIAKETGGKYFRATNSRELQKVYQLIDRIEPVATDEQWYRPETSLHYLPLSLAAFFAALLFFKKATS